MLTDPIALKRFEPIPRWHSEVIEPGRGIEKLELSPRRPLDRAKPADRFIVEQTLGVPIGKALDHGQQYREQRIPSNGIRYSVSLNSIRRFLA